MAKSSKSLESSPGHMCLCDCVSELNMTARGCGGSSSSLPGTPGGDGGSANSVLSWAVSFENLLEDPCGVAYFTAFLKSEVSAENILFWKACEKFRTIPATSLDELKAAALSIYTTYLSESAPYSVNIDDTAKTEEKDLEQPTPDMFTKAQSQIFKLMKMDSYRRFVRSPLYQRCSVASVEGKHLPPLYSEPVRMGSREDVVTRNNASIKNGGSSPRVLEHAGVLGSRIGVEGGYCCVYLPDGSASLAPTRKGQSIKDMLASLCEKRGFPLKDVIIYLQGMEKQPLSLDQDCSVLRDQQVSLELRVAFMLENAFSGRTNAIVAKSNKTLQDALQAVMQKHQLKPQEVSVSMVGSDEPLSLSSPVYRLANKTIHLDKTKGKDQTIIPRGSGSFVSTQTGAMIAALEARSSVHTDRTRTQHRPSKNRAMDGFLDMLTRAQCCRVDDQRGLLTKEQLEIPSFLQLPSDQAQETDPSAPSNSSSSTADSKSESEGKRSDSSKTPEESPDPDKSKDSRETTV
ncbi:transcript variant X2 [Nothobranchius furzeri]|uniref:Transcript variant X2 n=1 Tax=Nothobranchius furzeri TaxID=105023 RepID=A0A9D2YWK2_NOTFU|nr:transcript variant X2 [Nothobranchius furzeri]